MKKTEKLIRQMTMNSIDLSLEYSLLHFIYKYEYMSTQKGKKRTNLVHTVVQ